VTLPAVGPVDRKVVIGGGVVVVGIVGYYVARRFKRAATPATVSDPATGSTDGTGLYTNPVPGASGSDTVNSTDPTAIRTNAQWTQKVLDDIGNRGIYDQAFAAAVLGRYLAGVALTADEANVVRTAWGLEGQPPEGNHPIVLATTGSTPGSGNPAPTPTPVPVPHPVPGPPPGPPAVAYVDTARYTKTNPPWNSTLSGIASHEHTTVDHLLTLNRGNPDVIDRNTIRYPGRVRVR